MPLPLLLPLTILAGKGIYDAVSGAIGAGKARREQRELEKNRPKYTTPRSEYDMLSLLQGRANQGLSDSVLQGLNQQSERGLTSSLDAIIKGGGSVNNVGSAYQGFLDSVTPIQLANYNAQQQNLNNYLTQQRRISDYQDKEWEINTYAPWADKSAAVAQRLGQAQSRQAAGIGSIGTAVGGYFGNINQQDNLLGTIGQGMNLLGQVVNRNGGGNNNATNVPQQMSSGAPSLSNNFMANNNAYGPSFNFERPYDFSQINTSSPTLGYLFGGRY